MYQLLIPHFNQEYQYCEGYFLHRTCAVLTNARVPLHRLRHDARPSMRARSSRTWKVVLNQTKLSSSARCTLSYRGRPTVRPRYALDVYRRRRANLSHTEKGVVGQVIWSANMTRILRRHGRRGSLPRPNHPRFIAILMLESRGITLVDK